MENNKFFEMTEDVKMKENASGLAKLSESDLQEIEGGVYPALIFLGKCVLTGCAWGAGYYIVDKVIK